MRFTPRHHMTTHGGGFYLRHVLGCGETSVRTFAVSLLNRGRLPPPKMRANGVATCSNSAPAGKHRLWFMEWPLGGWVGPGPVATYAWQFSDLVRAA